MHSEPHSRDTEPQSSTTSFLRSRAGMVFVFFLAAIGLLLAYEHRAHIFAGSGVFIVLLLLCPLMHVFMHGGHGHGGHRK